MSIHIKHKYGTNVVTYLKKLLFNELVSEEKKLISAEKEVIHCNY